MRQSCKKKNYTYFDKKSEKIDQFEYVTVSEKLTMM
jgi:hypothetical protein